MEYQVPQFIEVEDKVVGPLGLKQFIYLAGGAGICVIFFFTLPILFAILLSIPFGGFAVALAFYKVNGKPFINVLESGFSYYTKSKLFLWKRDEAAANKAQGVADEAAAVSLREQNITRGTPRLTGGKLHDLAWTLDVKNNPIEPAQSGRVQNP